MARRVIRDSRVLVTGASSGIGNALAVELAVHGARLVVNARRADRLTALAEQIRSAGGEVECVAGDITDAQVRMQALDAAVSRLGGLDALVNNAGIGAWGRFETATPSRLRTIMEVNFFAAVELTRLAIPILKLGTNPIVVNVASILGHRGAPRSSEYCASKFALRGFSEALRAELAQWNIEVLVVSPGTTDTDFFDSLLERQGETPWPRQPHVPAGLVARRVRKAMERGRHEIIPSFRGRILCWANRLSPWLVDALMRRYG